MAGRKAELRYLEQLYSEGGNQILVLYGRADNQGRQLVQEFCKNKKSFYYYAPEVSAKAQKSRKLQNITRYLYQKRVMIFILNVSKAETAVNWFW